MDLNLTGYFWGMPVDFSGDIAANSAAVAVATPWMAFFQPDINSNCWWCNCVSEDGLNLQDFS